MPHTNNISVLVVPSWNWDRITYMPKYDALLHKIQTNPASNLVLNPVESELLEEALITLQFLELIFKHAKK